MTGSPPSRPGSEDDAFAAMLAALPTDQLATAKLSDVSTDLVLGPGHDCAFPIESDGVQVSTLPADPKTLVLAAIATHADDVDDSDAHDLRQVRGRARRYFGHAGRHDGAHRAKRLRAHRGPAGEDHRRGGCICWAGADVAPKDSHTGPASSAVRCESACMNERCVRPP